MADMWNVLKAAGVLVVGLALAAGAYYAGGELGRRGPVATASAASTVAPDMPTPLTINTAPVATLAPAPPPTPSYTYTWDLNNPNQCFNPSDPNLPANAPRCPPRSVPSDPKTGPVAICPTGYVAVIVDGQGQCAKKAN